MNEKPKVLIVDDEPNIVLSLDFLMRKQGYAVFIARDGSEAVELLDAEAPDLVLLDIMMPKMNGYEVCAYIRSKPELNASKVVFLSAKSKESDVEKGLSLGADLYIVKPFSTRDLLKKIKGLFDN